MVANLYIFKTSNYRQLDIATSRKKVEQGDDDKVNESLPNKIATENWRKRKQYKGPGFFQKNKTNKVRKHQEEWERLPVISWGGEYVTCDGRKIKLTNTCTLDNFLQILLVFYSLNINQMQRLFSSTDPLVLQINEVLQLLLTNDFSAAKYTWMTQICKLTSSHDNIICTYCTDKQIIVYPIRSIFRRKYDYSECSSGKCPVKSDDAMSNYVRDMTLHHPDIAVNEPELIEQSIKEWALGFSSKALISCKGVFNENPDHEEYISEIDKNNPIIRCSGWRSPLNKEFVTKHPFLLFDISAEFANDVKDLSRIPYEISVYGITLLE